MGARGHQVYAGDWSRLGLPQPLLPQMLAGFLDPTLGLIVTLLGPVTDTHLRWCTFCKSPLSCLSSHGDRSGAHGLCQLGCLQGWWHTALSCTYRSPGSLLGAGRVQDSLVCKHLEEHPSLSPLVLCVRKPKVQKLLRILSCGALGAPRRLPGSRPALWKCRASCVLCDHVCAPWDVGVCMQVPWCLSQGPVSVSPVSSMQPLPTQS